MHSTISINRKMINIYYQLTKITPKLEEKGRSLQEEEMSHQGSLTGLAYSCLPPFQEEPSTVHVCDLELCHLESAHLARLIR